MANKCSINWILGRHQQLAVIHRENSYFSAKIGEWVRADFTMANEKSLATLK